uniref:Uncharacterized protein n=1 Tax=Rhizophora mucronata TaxID=61149 RepID=A0A2P2R514_RHIMU
MAIGVKQKISLHYPLKLL